MTKSGAPSKMQRGINIVNGKKTLSSDNMPLSANNGMLLMRGFFLECGGDFFSLAVFFSSGCIFSFFLLYLQRKGKIFSHFFRIFVPG